MHFSEIIKLQFEKECHTLLCILKLFRNIIHQLCLKNAWLPPIFFLDFNNNFLLTEREGRTGEHWPDVEAVRTERSEVRTKTTEGQYSPVRLELARLVRSLLYGFLISFCFVFASP